MATFSTYSLCKRAESSHAFNSSSCLMNSSQRGGGVSGQQCWSWSWTQNIC